MAELTPEDIVLLKNLKSKGVSKEKAFQIMNAAKQELADAQKTTPGPGSAAGRLQRTPKEEVRATAEPAPFVPPPPPTSVGRLGRTPKEEARTPEQREAAAAAQAPPPPPPTPEGPGLFERAATTAFPSLSGVLETAGRVVTPAEEEETLRETIEPTEREQRARELFKPKDLGDTIPFVGPAVETVAEGVAKGAFDFFGNVVGFFDKATGSDFSETKFVQRLKEAAVPENRAQEVVSFGTQVLTGSGLGAGLARAVTTRAIGQLANYGRIGKIASTVGKVGAASVGSTAGVTVGAEGRLPTGGELAIGGFIDALTFGLGKVFKPQKLISKAMGITKSQKQKFNATIKKFIDPKTGKPFFENLDDYALKNGITGGRDNMVDQAVKLFEEASESKKAILKGVKIKTKNTFNELFETIIKKYDVPGQANVVEELTKLSKKKVLTAVELDRVRQLGDNLLTPASFTGDAKPAAEGLKNLISPVRDRLGVIDPTGQIKRANLDKALLSLLVDSPSKSLTKALEASAEKSVLKQGATRALFTGGGSQAIAAGLPIPGAQQVATVVAAFDVLTAIPEVASALARANKTGALDAVIKGASPVVKGAVFKFFGKDEEEVVPEEEKKKKLR